MTYFNGREEGFVPAIAPTRGNEENEFYAAAVSDTLGPGLRTSLTFFAGERQNEFSGAANVAADVHARAVLLGIHASF